MTALLLHGIVVADVPVPPDAPPHLRVPAGALCGIATPASSALIGQADDPPMSEACLHHEVLSAYVDRNGTLPVRFGAVFSDADALAEALTDGQAAYLAQLDRVSRCVEYLLKLTLAPSSGAGKPVLSHEDGRGFLKKKRMARDDRRSVSSARASFAGTLAQRLNGVSEMLPVNGTADPQTLATTALLVPRHEKPRMIASAEALAREAAALGLTLSLRGPCPCYSFVSGVVSDEHADRTELSDA